MEVMGSLATHVTSAKTHNYAQWWAQDKNDALFLTHEPCEFQGQRQSGIAGAGHAFGAWRPTTCWPYNIKIYCWTQRYKVKKALCSGIVDCRAAICSSALTKAVSQNRKITTDLIHKGFKVICDIIIRYSDKHHAD